MMSATTYHYILTHGLNVQPSVMERLAEELQWPLDRCTFVCLPGHAPGESLRHITADRWLDSFSRQYQAAFSTSEEVVYVGYSLGGLLMTYLLGKERVPAPAKQILFAPALSFKQWTRIPTFFPASVLDQLLIPSFTPKGYKATSGVTIGAYKALFEVSTKLESLDSDRYNLPTLVLCDQRDELVHAEGLRTFIQEKKLSNWQLHILPSRPWKRWGKKHLLVAREYQSDAHWAEVKDRIIRFLNA